MSNFKNKEQYVLPENIRQLYFKIFPKESKLDFYIVIGIAFIAGFIEGTILL